MLALLLGFTFRALILTVLFFRLSEIQPRRGSREFKVHHNLVQLT